MQFILLLFFFFSAMLRSFQDLSSGTRDSNRAMVVKARILTTRPLVNFPIYSSFNVLFCTTKLACVVYFYINTYGFNRRITGNFKQIIIILLEE